MTVGAHATVLILSQCREGRNEKLGAGEQRGRKKTKQRPTAVAAAVRPCVHWVGLGADSNYSNEVMIETCTARHTARSSVCPSPSPSVRAWPPFRRSTRAAPSTKITEIGYRGCLCVCERVRLFLPSFQLLISALVVSDRTWTTR